MSKCILIELTNPQDQGQDKKIELIDYIHYKTMADDLRGPLIDILWIFQEVRDYYTIRNRLLLLLFTYFVQLSMEYAIWDSFNVN